MTPHMRWICRFLVCFSLVAVALPANAAWSKLSEEQLEELHQEVCSIPPRRGAGKESEIWFCDVPRAYESKLPDYHNDNDPEYKKHCPLSFNQYDGLRITRIFYGRFTENEQQALIMYSAGCEPHANNYGGTALFRIVEGKLKLIRYYVGVVAVDCVVPPSQGRKLQKAFCFASDIGQGDLFEKFGPLNIEPNGAANITPVLSAGNLHGFAGPVTDCPRPNPQIHDFSTLKLAGRIMVLEGRYLAPKSVTKACARYKAKEFSDEELELREENSVIGQFGFIRPDEEKYLKVIVKISTEGKIIRFDFTSQPVSAPLY